MRNRLIPILMVALFSVVSSVQAESRIKNVLFLISDDLKASVLGCYGDEKCQTPNLDKLASEGLVFNRAYCQGTVCGPSRKSFMHSRYLDDKGKTMGQHFQENGMYSARVGKIFHMRVPGDIIGGTNGEDVEACWTERFNSPGLEAHTPGDYACLNLNIFTDELEGRESTRMKHRMFVTVSYDGDGSDQPDYKTAEKIVELLRIHKDEPFFLAAGMVRPHYPMVAPKKYFDMYPWQEIELPYVPENDTDDIPKIGLPSITNLNNPIGKHPDNIRRMWAGYYASVTFMDEQMGKILDELDRLGLRDSTAIVFTSDHGYHLGEHTFWQKANLHEEATRVPLIISIPGYKPGRTDSIVELMDLYPTLSEVLGFKIPEDVQGISLLPVLKDHNAFIKEGALSFHNGASIREPKWAYMLFNDGSDILYNMEKDPGQFTNLARNPENAADRARLKGKLMDRLKEAGIVRIVEPRGKNR